VEACLIVTYRCNAKCYMCNTWRYPSSIDEEFKPELLNKIPGGLSFVNITGGEPFLRDDLQEVLDIAVKKTRRLVISTNGYFTEKIAGIARAFGNRVGFRISLEGLPAANDELRGIKNGFDHGLRSLLTLQDMGIRDIGFGITVSERNAEDLIELWRLSKAMGLEFATATTHNSFYFHKCDNTFLDAERVALQFERMAEELLKTHKPKDWFRAYFNMGLANKVRGRGRLLPCRAGTSMFFLDPFGNVVPCNGSDEPMIMGNLHKEGFEAIWNGPAAAKIRRQVGECVKQCWMIGSVAPAMKENILVPVLWIVRNKMRLLKGGSSCRQIT
jgi:Fe-coproporphyrin III synthase